MKKIASVFLALLCIVTLPGCVDTSKNTPHLEENTCSFYATVLESGDSYLLVEPASDSIERKSSDKIQISLYDKTSWPIPNVGDTVNIVHSGEIMETYPAQLAKVFRIEIVSRSMDGSPNEK